MNDIKTINTACGIDTNKKRHVLKN